MAFTRSQILTFFWASASWTLHPKPSLIENQSLQKKVSSHLPYDLSGLKLSCSEGDGISNVLTLVHSSLCVAMLLDEGWLNKDSIIDLDLFRCGRFPFFKVQTSAAEKSSIPAENQ